jgi:hypothetical protein
MYSHCTLWTITSPAAFNAESVCCLSAATHAALALLLEHLMKV